MRGYYCSVIVAARDEVLRFATHEVRIEVLVLVATFVVAVPVTDIVGTDLPTVLISLFIALGGLMLMLICVFVWSLTWAPVNLERGAKRERTHLREILRAKNTHREIQEMHAALTREGVNLAGEILSGSDLALEREKVEEWRSRVITFLNDHVDPTYAVSFEVHLKRGVSPFQFEGRHYSGDIAVLASQVDNGQDFLASVYVPEDPYYDYLREQWEAELKGR